MSKLSISAESPTVKRLSVLARRAFLYLWIGQMISLLGDYVYRVGLPWFVTNQGGIAAATALGITMSLPIALFGIFAGTIVDRSDRFKLLIATDLVRAIIVACIALLLLNPSPNIVLICGGAALLSIASLVFTPAIQSVLPELAKGNRDELIRMDSWILGTMSTLGVIGPAAAGVLLTWIPVTWLIGFDAVSFAFSALMLMLIRREIVSSGASEQKLARGKFFTNFKEGLGFLAKHPVLRPQFATFPFMESVSYAIPFLLPAFVHESLKADSKMFGLLLALWALGRVGGMAIISRTSLKQKRGRIFMVNFILQGIAVLMVALIPILWVAMIGFVLLGLPAGAAQVSMSSYIQVEIPPQMRGRVFAALTSFITWLMPLGPLVLGALAAWQGVHFAFFIIAAVFLLGGFHIASYSAVREVQ